MASLHRARRWARPALAALVVVVDDAMVDVVSVVVAASAAVCEPRTPLSLPATAAAAPATPSTIADVATAAATRRRCTRRVRVCTSAHAVGCVAPLLVMVQGTAGGGRDRVVLGDQRVVRSHRGLPRTGPTTYAPRAGGTSPRLG